MFEQLRERTGVLTLTAALALPVGIAGINQLIENHRSRALAAMTTADLTQEKRDIEGEKTFYPSWIGAAQVLDRGRRATRVNELLEERGAK